MTGSTSERYRAFAQREAAGSSPSYERLSYAVAFDVAEIIHLLDALPEAKRQPNLLFASVRILGGPVRPPEAFIAWVRENWDILDATMRTRRPQTNEPGRCATLLPSLCSRPGPLALLEVGASAGLCLYPDRWQ